MRQLLVRAFVLMPMLVYAQAQPDPCATGELPCDAARPWMRGRIEKGCARTPAALAKLKKDKPNVIIEACACVHHCDPKDEHAEATDERRWDGRCAARCSPDSCRCPHPCDS